MFSFVFANNPRRATLSFEEFLSLVAALFLLALIVPPLPAQTPAPPVTTASPMLTEKDRESAINHLKASRERLVNAVGGLSEAQLKFKPAPDRWSIVEVAEHIALAEDFLFNTLTNDVLKSPLTPDKERKITDDQVLALMTNRSVKAQAPEPAKPAGKWKNVDEIMQEFEKRRSRTIEFVKTTQADLRGHFTSFGPGGEIDALQWFLMMSAHCDRHIAQISEVKADPSYPKTP